MAAINRFLGRKDLKKQLASAACTLLGTVPAGAAVNGGDKTWGVDSAVLYYQEADDRVSAIEPVVNFWKGFSGNRKLNVKFTLDALTGATPLGAVPSTVPQTFTRPSGSGTFVVQPGEIPLDDTFRDTRIAVNGSWQQPVGRLSLLTLGGNFSKEYDFLSIGGSALLARDFNDRNTTLTLGVSTEQDSIDPVGGVPIPFAAMAAPGATQPRQGGSESKSVLDVMAGVTQVINPKTLMQFNYSASRSSGYLNDPYKVVSVIDPATGAPLRHLYENRPDSRLKHALYWLLRRKLARDVVSGSYRYFFDDWGVKSHTVDLNYTWKPSERWWLEPHLRYYTQSEADFYRFFLLDGEPVPREASADYRLGAFNGITLGLEHGWKLRNENLLVLKLEYYTTKGDDSAPGAVGALRGLDLYPDLKATIVQVQYKF